MKKSILSLLLLVFYITSYAQYNNKKTEPTDIISNSRPSNWDLFEKYEKLHRSYQYTSIGSATISAGLLITYGCIKE